MKRIVVALGLLAASVATAARPAAAQNRHDLFYKPRSAGYWAIGLGGGNFKLTCSFGCLGDQLTAPGTEFNFGFHVSRRVRIELGGQMQRTSDGNSNAINLTAGAGVYLVGNLHVRGAYSFLRSSVEDSLGTSEGSGGHGFLVGAGYDLRLGRQWAITPYVNFTSGSISKLTRTLAGGSATTGSATLRALHFGAALSFMRGDWICVTPTGDRVRVVRANRSRALACLDAYVSRGGRRPDGLKY